jgi:hypothetical protein
MVHDWKYYIFVNCGVDFHSLKNSLYFLNLSYSIANETIERTKKDFCGKKQHFSSKASSNVTKLSLYLEIRDTVGSKLRNRNSLRPRTFFCTIPSQKNSFWSFRTLQNLLELWEIYGMTTYCTLG